MSSPLRIRYREGSEPEEQISMSDLRLIVSTKVQEIEGDAIAKLSRNDYFEGAYLLAKRDGVRDVLNVLIQAGDPYELSGWETLQKELAALMKVKRDTLAAAEKSHDVKLLGFAQGNHQGAYIVTDNIFRAAAWIPGR